MPHATRERARYATMAVFFIAGMMYASWGVHVPTVRDKFALSPGMLSFALLAVAGGSILRDAHRRFVDRARRHAHRLPRGRHHDDHRAAR